MALAFAFAFSALAAGSALAGETAGTATSLARLSDARVGTLALRAADGGLLAAPTLKTHVAIKITGMVARVKVAQQFTNPNAQWQEGVDVFPLPEKRRRPPQDAHWRTRD